MTEAMTDVLPELDQDDVDFPILPGGRRRRRKPGERAWAHRFERGSLAELHHAREVMAVLVLRNGEWLLPIFERLEDEIDRRQRRDTAMDRVRALAAGGRRAATLDTTDNRKDQTA